MAKLTRDERERRFGDITCSAGLWPSGLWGSSECIMYAAVTGAMREGFERGFLGIVEVLFVIGEGKIQGESSAGAY